MIQTLNLPSTRTKSAVGVMMASIILAFSGRLSLPLPFTPVPISLQNNLILLAGLLLGPRKAFYAVALLLFQAAIGLPVLSAGAPGIVRFLGPTGGYLLAYAFSAYVAGFLYQKKKSPSSAFLALSAGLSIQYLLGALWLSTFVGLSNAFMYGVAPFLPGDLLITLGMVSLSRWRSHLN